jgi:hypothetical protein
MSPSLQTAPAPDRIRQRLPERYSWIDQKARGRLQGCPSHALTLYLMLTLVGNRHGLSYHGEMSLTALTKLDKWQVRTARRALVEAGLIAYARPMYQVLDLSGVGQGSARVRPASSHPAPSQELSDEDRRKIVEGLRQLRKELASRQR